METTALFATPDLFQARRVLCVQPHYDDNDIGAGGTVAALRAAGADILYLTATDDLMGVIDPALPAEVAAARLRAEQEEAGAIIGVGAHYRLGYPDAGAYDYLSLRRDIIRHIRLLRPDLLLTVDPWLSYEAHRDHRQVGLATAEAFALYNLPRLATDPQVDAAFAPYEMLGIGFYFTEAPNTLVDITPYRETKYRALACYRSQLTPEAVAQLTFLLDLKQREYGQRKGCAYAEALKLLRPGTLHCNVDARRM